MKGSARISKCEELVRRLQEIEWNTEDRQRKSQVRLLQEYLHRSALWFYELGRGAWPFYDVAEIIDPSVRAPRKLVEETRISLSSVATYHVLHTAEWALHFAQLEDSGIEIPDLPHPYDPLIILYERGDTINYTSAGFIEVDGVSVPRKNRERYARISALTDFSEQHLDELDRHG